MLQALLACHGPILTFTSPGRARLHGGYDGHGRSISICLRPGCGQGVRAGAGVASYATVADNFRCARICSCSVPSGVNFRFGLGGQWRSCRVCACDIHRRNQGAEPSKGAAVASLTQYSDTFHTRLFCCGSFSLPRQVPPGTFEIAPKWGEPLRLEHERVIAAAHGRPVFVTHYPAACKPFYARLNDFDGGRTVRRCRGHGTLFNGSLCVDILKHF